MNSLMTKYSRALLALVGATVLLAALVGAASAAHLRTSSQNIRAVWTGMEFEAGVTIRCPVTLEGSLHSSTIAKTAGALIGYITRAIVGEATCANGRARTLTENLPWHVRYASFAGTLPNITSVSTTIIGARFLVLASFPIIGTISCLYITESGHAATGRFNLGTGGVVSSVTAGGTISSQTGGCPEGSLGGTGTVSVLGTSTQITITLI
jgi:hypothetical protein